MEKFMTHADNEAFVKYLEQYKKHVSKDKRASREFLKALDSLTEKGKLPKNHKQLCIQSERG
jgi:hypothetical protein